MVTSRSHGLTAAKQLIPFMREERVIDWLMKGDVAIQYQTVRDLLHGTKKEISQLQKRIETEGWGQRFLSKQNPDGHWGITFYQPKWTSTHYTLLDLKTIGFPANCKTIQKSVSMVLEQSHGQHGGINLASSLVDSDVCVNGMILSYGSYFLPNAKSLELIIDYLLQSQMPDGGWNCLYLKPGTTHSSLHSTISVLEGLLEYRKSGRKYRITEVIHAEKEAVEFLLIHNLYQSHRTGSTIDERMVRLSFPCRWRYDILRCLDFFQAAKIPYDARMQSALDILIAKRRKDGKWPLQEKHKGDVHFDMETTGAASRWNTLRCLRVLKHFDSYSGQK
jgi:hypothetical protein